MAETNIIYKVESGSHLYGTNTENSDLDYISVFIPSNYELLSLQKKEYVNESTKKSSENRRNTKEDIDNQLFSISNYLHLVLEGNPNLTEILFSPNPIIEKPVFTVFKENSDKIISKRIFKSFNGFALSQLKKLQYKSLRYIQLEKSLDYLNNNYKDLIIDPRSSMDEKLVEYLNVNLSEYKGKKNNVNSFHIGLPVKEIYEKIKSEYERYGWRTKTRTFSALGYDVKFASHALRLFYEAESLMRTGRLEFPIEGKAREDIMAVKEGCLNITEFYELCDHYDSLSRKSLENTVLKEKPDYKWANNILVYFLTNSILEEVRNNKGCESS
jgi:predicted nucleotidyltransferase